MAHFEKFTRGMAPLRLQPRITIQRRGVVSLNLAAFDAIGLPDAVQLFFDRRARVMGLSPAANSDESAHHVRATSPSGPWVFSATAFLRYYDLLPGTSTRWHAYLDIGLLCADLSGVGTPVTSNRARHE